MTKHARRSAVAPLAPQHPTVWTQHGDRRVDLFAWLRNRKNPATLRYLHAENTHTERVLRPLRALRTQVARELRALLPREDSSAPAWFDGYWYYRRLPRGAQYWCYCRKRGSLRAREEMLLDMNRIARGRDYCSLGDWDISSDGRYLAYTLDTTGNEIYTLHIVDLQRTHQAVASIHKVADTVIWAQDAQTLWYQRMDATQRVDQVWTHRLGTSSAKDRRLYIERDAEFVVGIDRTRNREYLCICSESKNTSEVRIVPARTPDAAPRVLIPRRAGHEYEVEHAGDQWYIRTNWRAKSFYVVRAPLHDARPVRWTMLVPARADADVESIDLFARYVVLTERAHGLPCIRALPIAGGRPIRFCAADPAYSVELGENPDFQSDTIRLEYTSPVQPVQVLDWNPATQTQRVRKRQRVPGYRPGRYRCWREWVRSPDGTRVPLTIVADKDHPRDGTRPLMLYGYGSYGHVTEAEFIAQRLVLLRRGFAIALAHVRGGGELGQPWYDAGKVRKKQNSFTDFCACAEWLLKKRWTSAPRLIARGASAGGLLVGAAVNQRPELFGGVVAGVPFVDVVTTMSDPTIPLTTMEYTEWGNPAQRAAYRDMRAYSPVDNVAARAYPPMLVTAGLHDPRVGFWEPAKWVAKLRACKTDTNPLLLFTEMGAGHGGKTGRYARIPQQALEYTFMLWIGRRPLEPNDY